MNNRFLLSALLLLTCTLLHGQIVINMEQDGGVYKVPCSVNGVRMMFVFDTGASTVSLSKSMASFMQDNGALKTNDFLGKSKSQIADGSIVDVEVVNLRDFEIGGLHLNDVIATVKEGQNVPLLLGQSAIEKLGRVSIEKGRLIIHQANANLSSTQIASLRSEIEDLLLSHHYENAIDKLSLLRRATELNGEDYYYYTWALTANEDFEQALLIGKDWEASGVETDDYCRGALLDDIATAYLMTGKYDEAIRYFQKALPLRGSEQKSIDYSQLANCYDGLDNKIQTEIHIKKALSARYTYLNNYTENEWSIADVIAGNVRDQDLGIYYYQYASFEEKYNGDYSQRDYYLRLSAKCGFQDAIDFCFKNNINFTR